MRRCRAGFTLVETMVAGTIMVSMSLIAVLWITGVSDLWWTSNTQSQVRTVAQQTMNRVLAELRSGTRTAAASPPNAVINPALLQDEIRITLTLQKQTPKGRTVSATSVESLRLRN